MGWKPSSCHLALLCSPQVRRRWRQLPDALLGRDRACIWYWVNLIKIEKERQGAYLQGAVPTCVVFGQICRSRCIFSSTISQGPNGILFFCLSTLLSFFIYFIITWLRWGPCLCSRSLLFFSGLNRKHIVCFVYPVASAALMSVQVPSCPQSRNLQHDLNSRCCVHYFIWLIV